jgi:aspartate racemase
LAACLVARIEKRTGHNIPVATLFEAPTVGELARKIDERTYTSAWSPLVELRHAGGSDTEPLFCVHSLGANLVSYKKLVSLLNIDQPIYVLQPHGLDGRQEPLDNIEQMAAAYLQEIRAKQPGGPYYLSGICLGGVLAYEIAQQLLAAGEQVRFLLLIDTPMPGTLEYLHTRSTLTEYLDRHLGEMLLLRPGAKLKYLARWLGNGAIRLASALGWRRGEGSVARATERVVKANLKAFLSYRAKPYAGKLTLFICSDSPCRSYEDRRLAWSVPARGGLELHLVPGNHLSMVEEPHVRVMAQTLQRCLDRLESHGRKLTERSRAAATS